MPRSRTLRGKFVRSQLRAQAGLANPILYHPHIATENPIATPQRTPAAEHQEGANPGAPYYPALDGLRAVAVLLVFGAHYAGLHAGWMGVNIFFVLSGFLITGILFDSQDKTYRFRDFYVRRTLRIFPLYYAVWLAFLLATPLLHIAWQPVNFLWPVYLGNWIPLLDLWRHADYPLHLLMSPLHRGPGTPQEYYLLTGHFWSLCIEEQFYLLWPLVVFTVRKRSMLLRICCAAIVLLPLARMACMYYCSIAFVENGALHNFTFLRLDEFLVGGFAALLLRGPAATKLRASAAPLFWAALALLLACRLYQPLLHPDGSDLLLNNYWILSVGITLVDAFALGMILLCLKNQSWLARTLNFAPLRALGKISYGFYVFHDIPRMVYLHIQKTLGLPYRGVGLVIPFLGTLALSIASYNLLERPFLKLKTRFES